MFFLFEKEKIGDIFPYLKNLITDSEFEISDRRFLYLVTVEYVSFYFSSDLKVILEEIPMGDLKEIIDKFSPETLELFAKVRWFDW